MRAAARRALEVRADGRVDDAAELHLRQAGAHLDALEVPGIVPKLSGTPGTVRTNAPHVGDDTDAVLRGIGLTVEQIVALREKGIIQ